MSTNDKNSSARSSRSTSSSSAKPAAADDVNPETSATSKDDVTPIAYPGLDGTDHQTGHEVKATPAGRDELDERDATIKALRDELAAIRSQPDGQATEMQKALAALAAEVERMKAGQGLVPVPEPTEPDPYLYIVVLGCGDRVDGQHPHATAHFCKEHGTQRVDRTFPKSVEQLLEQASA